MSRTYYYSRANTVRRRKKSGNFKMWFLLAAIICLFVYFSGEILPQIENLEYSINDKLQQIQQIQPNE